MKVKDIVREDGQLPQIGKVTAQQPGVGGAPGMVTVTMSNGVKQMVPSNMISPGPDGKPMINTQQQPGQNGQPATAPPPTGTTGQPTVTMGQDVKVQEEPSNSSNTVNAIQKGAQLFASDGDPIEITSTRREVDQAYIADPANAGNRMGYVVFKGKKYLALNTGHKWKIGPTAYAEITGIMHLPASRTPVPSIDSRSLPPPQRQRPNPANMHKLEESAEVSRIKMLSGLK
jgi:hypothetical protein